MAADILSQPYHFGLVDLHCHGLPMSAKDSHSCIRPAGKVDATLRGHTVNAQSRVVQSDPFLGFGFALDCLR